MSKQLPGKRKLGPRDFQLTSVLGEGSYARVYLAIRKDNNTKYAAKLVNIKQIQRLKKQETVMRERKCLAETNHPNIVKLYYTFRDEISLYFILELMSGGELFELIERMKILSEDLAQFFAAEIVSAVEYLHKKGILHRDLKPENLLVTSDRHLKLTDFGTAGFMFEEGSLQSPFIQISSDRRSCVGTAEYVAPEVLDGKGQSGACDIWSIGCIIYHMLVGTPPFRGASDWLTFQEVKKCDPHYPKNTVSREAKDLLQKIFKPEAKDRISIEDMKKHKFFDGIDWKNLHKMEPPKWQEPAKDLGVMSVRELKIEENDSDEDLMSTAKRKDSRHRKITSLTSEPGTPVVKTPSTKELKEEDSLSNIQTDPSMLRRFLLHGEKVVYSGLITKRSFSSVTFIPRKRELILTSTPRILYLDPKKGVLKGEIPFSKTLKVHPKSRNLFVISSYGRDYSIKCLGHHTESWVDAINSVKKNKS